MPAYKDKKTNTWYVQFSLKGQDGKFHGKTKRGFETKRDALGWEQEEKNKVHGVLDMYFDSFCEIYFNTQEPRIKPSTFAMKKNIVSKHIIPYFKKFHVNEITSKDVMHWQTQLLKYCDFREGKKYKKSFLKTIHNQLNAILNFAVKYYNLPNNPASAAGNMGTDREIEMKFWTKEQYLQFRDQVMEEPLYYYAFECLYWLGIREGELLALTPKDINFNTNTVSINKTFYILNGQHYITSPKTRKSVREVKMPGFLAEELKDYMHLMYDCYQDDENRLFPVTKSSLYRSLKRNTKECGLPEIRVHDLRHSHVSLLIHMGYSAVSIAQRMGHESIHVTYRYAHMFPNVQQDMADALDLEMENQYVG